MIKECCEKYRYQFSQFKVVYTLARAGRELSTDDSRKSVPSGEIEYKDLAAYARAFDNRVRDAEAAR